MGANRRSVTLVEDDTDPLVLQLHHFKHKSKHIPSVDPQDPGCVDLAKPSRSKYFGLPCKIWNRLIMLMENDRLTEKVLEWDIKIGKG